MPLEVYYPLRKEIDKYVMLVHMQLYPSDPRQKEIMRILNKINAHCTSEEHILLNRDAVELVSLTQKLLDEIWEEVKKEAREGELIVECIINPWLPAHLRPKKENPANPV